MFCCIRVILISADVEKAPAILLLFGNNSRLTQFSMLLIRRSLGTEPEVLDDCMRPEPYFRLNSDTLAVDNSNGKTTELTVNVTGVRNADDPRMTEVQWQDCRLNPNHKMRGSR